MKRGHLQPRACRGRGLAWSRVLSVDAGQVTAVQYRLFLRLAHNGATLYQSHAFTLAELDSAREGGRRCIARELRGMRAQLRWRRDVLELEALGIQDTTPAPSGLYLAPGTLVHVGLDGSRKVVGTTGAMVSREARTPPGSPGTTPAAR